MVTFEDDEEIGTGYPDNSSDNDNDNDEPMDDVEEGDGDGDGEQYADQDGDVEGDADDNEDDGDNDDEDDQEDPLTDTPSRRRAPILNGTSGRKESSSLGAASSRPNPTVSFTSPSPRPSSAGPTTISFRPSIRPEALSATTYDVVPTMAAPHSTSINTVTTTPDMRWIFSGGTDGYIRKFNWADTVNGKLPLTVAQRHPFVDSVTKAGVLLSYWENEEEPSRPSSFHTLDEQNPLSPVYSLAVHNQALWLLSGLESGGINLQSVRHEEGKRITCLRKHTSAVSVLRLSEDEKSVLSGSWDKTILDWDLNTGEVKRSFTGSGGQISSIEPRPISSLPVPEESGGPLLNGTFSSNYSARPMVNGILSNGISGSDRHGAQDTAVDNADAAGSPADSLFGDQDSLFGDDKDGVTGPPGGAFGDDDDDEFSRAIASEMQQQQNDEGNAHNTTGVSNGGGPVRPPNATAESSQTQAITNGIDRARRSSSEPLANGLPHAADVLMDEDSKGKEAVLDDLTPSSESTFLDASIDGTVRVWDRRQPNPIARIYPGRSTPPWCMDACWSHDGNFIYAGRRNGTVDEYSLHKGLREPRRTFKFPAGSGPVSAIRPMPSGKHLVCASYDILRLYDLREQDTSKHSVVPFLIVPGHRTGIISQLYIDPTCTYMISTAGNRGWEGASTEVLLGYEIGIVS